MSRIGSMLLAALLMTSLGTAGAVMTLQPGGLQAPAPEQVPPPEPQPEPDPFQGPDAGPAPAETVPLAPGDYSDWREAGQTPEQLGERLRAHRVFLTEDGRMQGQIGVIDPDSGNRIPVREITMSFIKGGAVRGQVVPGPDGVFEVSGLEPGVYSIIGAGPYGYIAFGLHLLQAPEPQVNATNPEVVPVKFQEVVETLEIDALAVPPRDYGAVASLARAYIPANPPTPILEEPPPEVIPPEAAPGGGPDPAQGESNPGTTIRNHSVLLLQPDGRLVGRIRRLHPQSGRPLRVHRLNVFLVRNNSVVAQAPVTEAGIFQFRQLEPGAYSMVASSPEGFAAFSILVIPSPVPAAEAPEVGAPVRPVAQLDGQVDPANELNLDLALVQPTDMPFAVQQLMQVAGAFPPVPVPPPPGLGAGPFAFGGGGPFGGGGLGGFGGGGGGGFGGGGGGLLGALAGAGAGAALGAALADDDDDDGEQQLSSPFQIDFGHHDRSN